MKTYLIQLEKYDTLASTREKMRWSKANRILLIWPKRGKLSFTEPEMEVIQREAFSLGTNLAFVSSDLKVRDLAESLNISVFNSVPNAESSNWKRKIIQPEQTSNHKQKIVFEEPIKRNHKSMGNRLGRILIFTAALAAILSIIVFLIPAATVIIYPQLAKKEISIDITASPDIHEVNINGNLPAKIQTVSLSKAASGQSSGKTNLPGTFASGEVVFRNLSGQAVTVPIGTVLICANNPELKFATLAEASIDSGATSSAVGIQALEAGTSGNLEAGAITMIAGSLSGVLEVNNELPTTGGEDITAPSPTEADYAGLRNELLTQLRQDAITQLQQQPYDKLIDGTLDHGTVISEIRSVDVGSASDTFSLTLSVEFQALTYATDDLSALAEEALQASLDSDSMIYGKNISITSGSTPSGNAQTGVKWKILVSAMTGPIIDQNKIVQYISGKTKEEALRILDGLIQAREPMKIEIVPSIWDRLPWIESSIQVKVE